MKSVDSKALRMQFDMLGKAIVRETARENTTVARKTPYEPYDAIFTGRGSGG
ncbi:MAG: hypothetical protein P0Y59_01095 [Candidatus Sphingomonas phytovorans]|nr:hypothetical protein [Sphingomonas sp.]WEK00324.1 MAG: hypothetical protein P0Y59_01095 [Sphingomonas sp.]